MEEKDLMLGDWVHLTDKNVNARVTELRSGGCEFPVVTDHGEVDMLIDLEAIPLTEDILLKNGFRQHDILGNKYLVSRVNEEHIMICFKHSLPYSIEIKTPTKYFCVKVNRMSVHDLQHAMRMCGIEKEIEL